MLDRLDHRATLEACLIPEAVREWSGRVALATGLLQWIQLLIIVARLKWAQISRIFVSFENALVLIAAKSNKLILFLTCLLRAGKRVQLFLVVEDPLLSVQILERNDWVQDKHVFIWIFAWVPNLIGHVCIRACLHVLAKEHGLRCWAWDTLDEFGVSWVVELEPAFIIVTSGATNDQKILRGLKGCNLGWRHEVRLQRIILLHDTLLNRSVNCEAERVDCDCAWRSYCSKH